MCQALQLSAGSRLLCVYACKHMSACACVCVCAHLKALWLTFAPIRWGTRILSPSFLLQVEFSLADNYFSRDCCIPLLDTRGLTHTHACTHTLVHVHRQTQTRMHRQNHRYKQAFSLTGKTTNGTLWFWTFPPCFHFEKFHGWNNSHTCTTKSFHNHRQVDRQ